MEKNIFIYIPVNANPTRLRLRPPVFSLHFLAYYWSGQQALASYCQVANSTPLFWSNPTLLGIRDIKEYESGDETEM